MSDLVEQMRFEIAMKLEEIYEICNSNGLGDVGRLTVICRSTFRPGLHFSVSNDDDDAVIEGIRSRREL